MCKSVAVREENEMEDARVEVPAAGFLKIKVFWDVMPCRLVNRFGRCLRTGC